MEPETRIFIKNSEERVTQINMKNFGERGGNETTVTLGAGLMSRLHLDVQ